MLKNIYNNGQWAEKKAIRFYKRNGYSLKWQRKKVLGIEVDLLFKNHEHYLMVEVKTCSSDFPLEFCLSSGQRRRLSRVFTYLVESLAEPLLMELAVVSHQGEVIRLTDVLALE